MLLKSLELAMRNPSRAWLMARMATCVVILSGLVKFCSLPRALHTASPGTRRKQNADEVDRSELSTAIDAVLRANVFVFKPNCWKRATVLHRYLALRGVSTKIVFGLRKEADGELKGHAWLEADGEPILESAAPAYKTTYTLPSADPFEVELALMAQTRQA